MRFPAYRILNSAHLSNLLLESRHDQRFCFILGAGASVESGIPSSGTLEMRWMDCLMGLSSDSGTPPRNPEQTKHFAAALCSEQLLSHPFDVISAEWANAKEEHRPMSGAYYWDIARLRFHPNRANLYRYLEKISAYAEPSLGYHPLALMLTNDNRHNLVITTNFDTLVEDSLSLYTRKKPLVISHESMANFIDPDIQRPIVAKIHRGLMYEPFNSPDTIDRSHGWKEALDYVFRIYTPIVIGYSGGDEYLMPILEETSFRNGIYWCHHKTSGNPGQRILDFLEKQDGYLVQIDGFDSLMLRLGADLFKDQLSSDAVGHYFYNQCNQRTARYIDLWKELSNVSPSQLQEFIKQSVITQGELSEWDLNTQGNDCIRRKQYREAIILYDKAISINKHNAIFYGNRALAHFYLGKYDESIADNTTAINLDPKYSGAYRNRGNAHRMKKQYQSAINDYTIAFELNPDDASAIYWRAVSHEETGHYESAIRDYGDVMDLDANLAKQRVQDFINKQYHQLTGIKGFDAFLNKFGHILHLDASLLQKNQTQPASTGSEKKKTVFLSYSWDSASHKMWTKSLYDRLKAHGFTVILDQIDLIPGDQMPPFMEQAISQSDYTLIICTPKYKEKADARKGGVGYEESIITSDVLLTNNDRKYITILASGTWGTATPTWARGKYGIDLSDSSSFDDEFAKLVRTMNR